MSKIEVPVIVKLDDWHLEDLRRLRELVVDKLDVVTARVKNLETYWEQIRGLMKDTNEGLFNRITQLEKDQADARVDIDDIRDKLNEMRKKENEETKA